MAGFDLEAFISAPTLEQFDKCRKDDLISIAAHYQIPVLKQQLKREIKNIVLQKLVELGVLALPEGTEDGSLASDIHSEFGEEEQSGTAEVEGSEAKAVLPPFEPFSPASVGIWSWCEIEGPLSASPDGCAREGRGSSSRERIASENPQIGDWGRNADKDAGTRPKGG